MLQLYEHSLASWEQRSHLWHEQSMQLAKAVQSVEKQLILLRHGHAGSDELLPFLDEDEDGADEKGAMAQVQTLAFTGAGAGAEQHAYQSRSQAQSQGQRQPRAGSGEPLKPYPHRPYAVGLRAVRRCSDEWRPAWEVFPLKAFRGSGYMYLRINAGWDDADLLRELSRAYDRLRTVWRKWFSLRSVR